MNHQHITIDGIDVPRDLDHLILTAKVGKLSISEQVQAGYALEMWHNLAVKCERAIHQIAKGEPI